MTVGELINFLGQLDPATKVANSIVDLHGKKASAYVVLDLIDCDSSAVEHFRSVKVKEESITKRLILEVALETLGKHRDLHAFFDHERGWVIEDLKTWEQWILMAIGDMPISPDRAAFYFKQVTGRVMKDQL